MMEAASPILDDNDEMEIMSQMLRKDDEERMEFPPSVTIIDLDEDEEEESEASESQPMVDWIEEVDGEEAIDEKLLNNPQLLMKKFFGERVGRYCPVDLEQVAE